MATPAPPTKNDSTNTNNDDTSAQLRRPTKMAKRQQQQDSSSSCLRWIGFCGVDESIRVNQLALLSKAYPGMIEWGVLLRPDKEGAPRYPRWDGWIQQLQHRANTVNDVVTKTAGTGEQQQQQQRPIIMRLAAHLCGQHVNDVLRGKFTIISAIATMRCFQRVQINATAVNGVDVEALFNTSTIQDTIKNVYNLIDQHPNLEFIIQKNEETKPLWEGLLQCYGCCSAVEGSNSCDGNDPTNTSALASERQTAFPSNLSMLVDESKGTGTLVKSFPPPTSQYQIGYAGGIGPDNITAVLDNVKQAVSVAASSSRDKNDHHQVWIDMESRLRSTMVVSDNNSNNDGTSRASTISTTTTKDIFDLNKCCQVIGAVCAAGLMKHPPDLRFDAAGGN